MSLMTPGQASASTQMRGTSSSSVTWWRVRWKADHCDRIIRMRRPRDASGRLEDLQWGNRADVSGRCEGHGGGAELAWRILGRNVELANNLYAFPVGAVAGLRAMDGRSAGRRVGNEGDSQLGSRGGAGQS